MDLIEKTYGRDGSYRDARGAPARVRLHAVVQFD